ncbi:SymE family type I addiction module toxin [Paraburkholderia oxyphila]|uniref:SymE family type I addiction module toxin n=1 Tax=Paraburkholderia oxyphila TaxID=614212 RepID=UPI0009FD4FD9|nr:SymE family type I addiction module toxin [Paraburkholderia oxyphila]
MPEQIAFAHRCLRTHPDLDRICRKPPIICQDPANPSTTFRSKPLPHRALRIFQTRPVSIQQSRRYRRINARARSEPPLYPWIKLLGRWLELAGFAAGQRVRIEVHHGRLVITHD